MPNNSLDNLKERAREKWKDDLVDELSKKHYGSCFEDCDFGRLLEDVHTIIDQAIQLERERLVGEIKKKLQEESVYGATETYDALETIINLINK